MIWLKLIFIFLITFALIIGVKHFLRKAFHIEKEKKGFFTYNHINDLYKKINLIISIISAIVLFIVLNGIIFRDYSINVFLFVLIITTGIDYTVRVFFEWRYTQNPKQSLLTISEMFIVILVLMVILQFDLLIM